MDLGTLPPHLRRLMEALTAAMRSREPAIRDTVERVRAENPDLGPDALARKLIRSTRNRVAASGAASGAAAIAPGLGTLLSVGAATGQSLYALEQETELVMAIAILYGHELSDSDDRLLEALVVVGIAGGAVKLRENVLVAGGQRITVLAFRRLPNVWVMRAGAQVLRTLLGRVLTQRAAAAVTRAAPLAIGVAAGAGFDWLAVTTLGRAAMRYYGPGGPAARATPEPGSRLALESEDRADVEAGG